MRSPSRAAKTAAVRGPNACMRPVLKSSESALRSSTMPRISRSVAPSDSTCPSSLPASDGGSFVVLVGEKKKTKRSVRKCYSEAGPRHEASHNLMKESGRPMGTAW